MEPFLGQIQAFGFNFAPRGWAKCEGQLLPISQNSALFSLLGTIYGGDGRTTFALPDLRGRCSIHAGQGPGLSNYQQGQRGGAETTTLNIQNMPAHNHTGAVVVSNANATSNEPSTGGSIGKSNVMMGRSQTEVSAFNNGTPDTVLNGASVQTNNNGGGQSFNNVQPYLVVNWCIALQGIYPSRN